MHEQFGRYILLERIAIGGMAEIFRAKAAGLGGFEKILAIKRLHPRYSEDADFIEMLIDEARISVELSHSNVAQIFDLGKVDDHYFIAMEFIDGRDLYRTMKRMKERRIQIPVDGAAYLISECCAGLDYAHRKKDTRGRPMNIIHRDISPQNVLVSFEGESKLVDFGIAKAALRGYETESGIIKGKFYYMSPEQARGDPLDHRTDVFSLGIVMYELLTGELLYKDEDDATLLSRVRKADILPPSMLRPDIPNSVERIVMKTLSKDREDRYPSAQHLQKDLNKYLRSVGSSFGKARLSRMMREIFLDEAPVEESEELEAMLLRSRGDLDRDRNSIIGDVEDLGQDSIAEAALLATIEPPLPDHDAFLDNEEPTVDVTATADAAASMFGIDEETDISDRGSGSDLIELFSEEFLLVDEAKPTVNMDGPPAALRRAPRTVDARGAHGPPADMDDDLFEAESTRGLVKGARRGAPEPEPQWANRDDPRAAPPRFAPASRAQADVLAFASAPTPVPERPQLRAVPRAVAPIRAANADPNPPRREAGQRALTTDPSKGQPPSVHRPVRQRRPVEQPTIAGGLPAVGRYEWFTRERVIFGGVILLALVGAAVLTSLLIRPSEPVPSLEPQTVAVGTGALAPPGQGTIQLRSFPSGAKVKVGNVWLPNTTPTRAFAGLSEKVHVQIRLGDDYELYETDVTPTSDRDTVVDAQLVKLRGTLTVETRPDDATVFIDGREMCRTPCTLPDLPAGHALRVRILRDGFDPQEQVLDWNGRREQTINVRLEPTAAEPAATPRPLAYAEPVAGPVRRVVAPPAPRPRPQPPQRRVAPPPDDDEPAPRRGGRESGGQGFISVASNPWASVYINGNQVASETPLVRYPISTGSHSIQVYFKDKRDDRSSTKRVMVERGEETKVRF
ncbi:MAG: PEGA domain-containing protein [Myxococcales bacterium]|nr:PEGA domain-containing protein [Myxococcales bacterium]